MADRTAIEWTDATWNPVTGCTKVSAGCDNCYAKRFSERFRGVAGHPFENGFDLTLRPERLEQPLRWKAPRRIFVNSMSDLFHKGISRGFIDSVFATMERANWHQFQVLSKRSSRLRDYVNGRYRGGLAPAHIWLGTSIEDQAALVRLRHLKAAAASVRFISFEPLLGPVGTVDLTGIHWVIAGGESGPGARPVQIEWLRSIRDLCKEQHVAFFFKQWGGRTPKAGGNEIDGRRWLEWPIQAIPSEAWVA
jgi:protein gp37